jgi:Coenzyme PQQ synthesis protein D (PqqD)
MRASSGYTINAPDVVAEDLNGEIVILNLANGHYFSLGGIACPIWSLLLEGHTPQSIFTSIEARRPDLVDGSSEFVNRLIELNLITPRVDADAVSAGPIDELWSGNGPTIEVYDDLAELIFADPIHDVDEQAGWPTPRQTQ